VADTSVIGTIPEVYVSMHGACRLMNDDHDVVSVVRHFRFALQRTMTMSARDGIAYGVSLEIEAWGTTAVEHTVMVRFKLKRLTTKSLLIRTVYFVQYELQSRTRCTKLTNEERVSE
jgi:hypothetical protein